MKNKVDIFGTKYKIKYVDRVPLQEGDSSDAFYWGICDYDAKTISVATKNRRGKDLSEDDIKLNLLHELIHSFLGEGQYHCQNGDEPLVEWLAKCVRAAIKQNVI